MALSGSPSLAARLGEAAEHAIRACEAGRLVAESLGRDPPIGFSAVWAVGKAAAAMAHGAVGALGVGPGEGLVIGKTGSSQPAPPGFTVFAGAHPIPDEAGAAATRELLRRAAGLGAGSRALLLLSGGASALLAEPVAGLELAHVCAATRALLLGGANIDETNTLRRHLGAALGGRLARATRGELQVLALSDVLSSDPAAIGSGPASPDPTTLAEALDVGRRFGVPDDVLAHVARVEETPKPGEPCFARVRYQILATPELLGSAGVRAIAAAGMAPRLEPRPLAGGVEEVAAGLQARAARLGRGEVLVAFGEPTVRVSGSGVGGRAQHLALLMARALAGSTDRAFVACGSDGTDGPTQVAGATVDGTTWPRAVALGFFPQRALDGFDSHPLLEAVGSTLRFGPTGTNLTDLILLGRG